MADEVSAQIALTKVYRRRQLGKYFDKKAKNVHWQFTKEAKIFYKFKFLKCNRTKAKGRMVIHYIANFTGLLKKRARIHFIEI